MTESESADRACVSREILKLLEMGYSVHVFPDTDSRVLVEIHLSGQAVKTFRIFLQDLYQHTETDRFIAGMLSMARVELAGT